MKTLTTAALLLASLPFAAQAQQSTDAVQTARRLTGSILVEGKAYDYDQQLADGIGPRLTGSPNYERAVAWAQQQFRDLGLVNVHTEKFHMPALWEPEVLATGKTTAPREQTLHIYSLGWSPSTPEGGVRGNVLVIDDITDTAKIEAQRDKIHGSIVLVSMRGVTKYDVMLANVKKLAEFGAQAVLVPGRVNAVENAFGLTFDGSLSPLPMAQLSAEDYALIQRLLAKGPVSLEFSFKNRIRKDVEVENVIAEIRGRELPDEFVIVGGHLDSWHPGTGAQDNGTGVATVLETARAVAALGQPPRRTMRFILFGGEEEGLIGSHQYSIAHAQEAAHCDAVLVSDSGAEEAKGWLVMGRDDERESLTKLKPLLAGLGGDGISSDVQYAFDTDHAGFLLQGVPSLVLWTNFDEYMKLHHQPHDTFDSVNQHHLAQGVAVTAVTAYAIADSPTPFAKHLTPAEVEEMLKKAKNYDEYLALKNAGML
jgi:carboxypeptidase Q